MANRTATLYLNCKVADGKWRFYPVSKAANGVWSREWPW